MAEELKVLGQAKPAGGALTDLYTVPAGKQAAVSSITCCNQDVTPDAIRVSVAVNGAGDAAAQYVAWDEQVDPNDTVTIEVGMTLGDADVLRVRSANGDVSFNAFGSEVTP